MPSKPPRSRAQKNKAIQTATKLPDYIRKRFQQKRKRDYEDELMWEERLRAKKNKKDSTAMESVVGSDEDEDDKEEIDKDDDVSNDPTAAEAEAMTPFGLTFDVPDGEPSKEAKAEKAAHKKAKKKAAKNASRNENGISGKGVKKKNGGLKKRMEKSQARDRIMTAFDR